MQSITFLHALVGNDIIRKSAWNCFHVAPPNLSACQSRPVPVLLHTRTWKAACGERRLPKFKKLFLCYFAGNLQPGTEKEAQGVVTGQGEGSKMCSLLSRQLRITEQHRKDFASLPSSASFPTEARPSLLLRAEAEGALQSNSSTQELRTSWTSLWL